MEIFIHGTKYGYQIFNSPDPVPGLYDAAPTHNNFQAIGNQAYSISFNQKNIIFSKYIIIRDVAGDKRTGRIAFSIFVPQNKRLPGIEVGALLDKVTSEYSKPDKGYIDDRHNLYNKREDLSFVTDLIREYTGKLTERKNINKSDYIQGKNEPAYLFYDNKEELEKYFNFPFQTEYKDYKQIFLVDSQYKDEVNNPLNALKHDPAANLTGKIEFEKYQLNRSYEPIHDVKVELLINNDGEKTEIRRGDNLLLKLSKKYHKYQEIKGEFLFTGSEITPYLSTDKHSKTISINREKIREIKFDPKVVKLTLSAMDENDKLLDGVDFTIVEKSNNPIKKQSNGKEVVFEGEELGKRWKISAIKNGFETTDKDWYFDKSNPEIFISFILKKIPHPSSLIENSEENISSIISNQKRNPSKVKKNIKILTGLTIILSAFVLSAIVILDWIELPPHKDESITAKEIDNYISGGEFLLDSLLRYQRDSSIHHNQLSLAIDYRKLINKGQIDSISASRFQDLKGSNQHLQNIDTLLKQNTDSTFQNIMEKDSIHISNMRLDRVVEYMVHGLKLLKLEKRLSDQESTEKDSIRDMIQNLTFGLDAMRDSSFIGIKMDSLLISIKDKLNTPMQHEPIKQNSRASEPQKQKGQDPKDTSAKSRII